MDPVDHSSHRSLNSSSGPMSLLSMAEMVASQVEMVTEDTPVSAEMEMANRDTVQVVLATSVLKTRMLPRTNVLSNLTTTSSSALDHHRVSGHLREIIMDSVEDSRRQEGKDHLQTRMDHLMDRLRDQKDTEVNHRISTALLIRILLLLLPTMVHLDKILMLLHHPHRMVHRDRPEVFHQQEATTPLPPEMETLLAKDRTLVLHPHLTVHLDRQELLLQQETIMPLPTEMVTPPDKDRMLPLHPHRMVHPDRQEVLLQQETTMLLPPEMATLLAKDLMLLHHPHLMGHLARVVVRPIKDQTIISLRTITEMTYSLLNRHRPVMEYRTRIVSMAQIVSRMAVNSLPRHLITEPPMKVNSHLPHLITEHLMKVSKINLD